MVEKTFQRRSKCGRRLMVSVNGRMGCVGSQEKEIFAGARLSRRQQIFEAGGHFPGLCPNFSTKEGRHWGGREKEGVNIALIPVDRAGARKAHATARGVHRTERGKPREGREG